MGKWGERSWRHGLDPIYLHADAVVSPGPDAGPGPGPGPDTEPILCPGAAVGDPERGAADGARHRVPSPRRLSFETLFCPFCIQRYEIHEPKAENGP